MDNEKIESELHSLAQILDDETADIIAKALRDYAIHTLGRERSIAFQIAAIFS